MAILSQNISVQVQNAITRIKNLERIDFNCKSRGELENLERERKELEHLFNENVKKEPYFQKDHMKFYEDVGIAWEYGSKYSAPDDEPFYSRSDPEYINYLDRKNQREARFKREVEDRVPVVVRHTSQIVSDALKSRIEEAKRKAPMMTNNAPSFHSSPTVGLASNALTQACKSKDINQVREALNRGAKPDSQTLTWACFSQNSAIIEAVIDANAQPDGETLTAACATKQFKIVAQVLALGAQPGPRTLQLALQSGDQRIINAVQRAGAE